jgi:hypothetical protein
MNKDEAWTSRSLQLAWTLIFGLNLIVPLLLGWSMCGSRGKVGLCLAVAIYWVLGLLVCSRRKRWGRVLVSGSIPVAFSQFWPFAQMWAGIIAIRLWSILGSKSDPIQDFGGVRSLSGLGGFVVTWLTGGMLITVAVALGLILVGLFGKPSQSKPVKILNDEL